MSASERVFVAARTAEDIFRFVSDPERLGRTIPGVDRIEKVAVAEPIEVGTRLRQTFRFAGREIMTDKVVVRSFDYPRTFAYAVEILGFDGQSRYTIEDVAGGVEVSLEITISGGGLLRGLLPLIERAFAGQARARLGRLAELAVVEPAPGVYIDV